MVLQLISSQVLTVQAYKPGSWEMETGESEIPGQPQSRVKFKARLSYLRFFLKKKKKRGGVEEIAQ